MYKAEKYESVCHSIGGKLTPSGYCILEVSSHEEALEKMKRALRELGYGEEFGARFFIHDEAFFDFIAKRFRDGTYEVRVENYNHIEGSEVFSPDYLTGLYEYSLLEKALGSEKASDIAGEVAEKLDLDDVEDYLDDALYKYSETYPTLRTCEGHVETGTESVYVELNCIKNVGTLSEAEKYLEDLLEELPDAIVDVGDYVKGKILDTMRDELAKVFKK
ncbi:MAG: hypothetical protein DRJ40_08030 [Thermoprotei archaeon]|nr:MAG: hypothetical protein DRJ40_08030 [Thermoprotei archaeon]